MSETTKGYIAAMLNTLIVGFSFLFVKIALSEGNPIDILAHRFSFAFIAILPIACIKRKELHLKWSKILYILPIALLYPLIFFSLQIWGLYYISSAEAGVIQAVTPIFIMVLAVVILKEKISIRQGFFTVLSVLGVLFIFIMHGSNLDFKHFSGLILITLSCITMSFYSVLVRKNKEEISVLALTLICIVVGFVFFNILSAGQHIMNPDMQGFFNPFLSKEYLFSIFYLGVLSSLVTSALTNYSYTKIEAAKMGVFNNLVPVVAIVVGIVVLKEQLTWIELVGGIIIFVGVVGANINGKQKADNPMRE